MLTCLSNNLPCTSLDLRKENNEILGDNTSVLLAVKKPIAGVTPARKARNFTIFSLFRNLWKIFPVNVKKVDPGVTLKKGPVLAVALDEEDGPAERNS